MPLRVTIVFLLCCIGLYSSAQNFSNQWVIPAQEYKKIKVVQEGIYKIDYDKIVNSGFGQGNADPRNIQLFNNGVEIPLYAFGQDDGILDPGDYFLFYGKPNDGKLDSNLYVPRNSQPHDYYSLYSDTSVYFLTFQNNVLGKRYKKVDGSITTGNPALFYNHEILKLDTSTFYRGIAVGENYLSELGAIEGWFGNKIQVINNPTSPPVRQDVTINYPFQTPYKSNQLVPTKLNYLFFGVSNADISSIPSGKNHHIQIKQGSTILLDTLFYGYQKIEGNIVFNSLPVNPTFSFVVVDDQNLAVDAIAVGYLKLLYPRTFDFSDTTQRRFNLQTIDSSSYLNLSPYKNIALANPIVFDLTENQAITGSVIGNSFQVMISNTIVGKDVMVFDLNNNVVLIDTLLPVRMIDFNQSGSPQYVVVYHPLNQTAAINHGLYRNSPSGGNYRILLTNIEDLYDQFSYGIHHPLAIRYFIDYLIRTQTSKPEFLLLVGKGMVSDLVRKPWKQVNLKMDLIPTMGNPGSDNLLTSGLNGTKWEPAVPTGRISANNNTEAENFLSKIRFTEQMPPALWKKNAAFISGAKSSVELQEISDFQNSFIDSISGAPFGVNPYKVEKNTTLPVSSTLKTEIINQINHGLGLFSYFGHGSANLLAVDIGTPIDYNNQNKYPLMIFNGCSIGNCFEDGSLGEKFTLANQVGAVGVFAHSSLGIGAYIGSLSKEIFGQLNSEYNTPIGIQITNSLRNFQKLNNTYTHIFAQQAIFQGDPAMKLSPYDKPDFAIEPGDLFLNPDPANAMLDSFQLKINVKNIGKSVIDSLTISVGRQVENGIDTFGHTFKIKAPLHSSEVAYTFRSPSQKYQGNNKFTVVLDSLNLIGEVEDFANNKTRYNYLLPGNGINLISPSDFAIIGKDSIDLMVEYADLKNTSTPIIIEWDTLPTFRSPLKKSVRFQGNINLVHQKMVVSGIRDSLVYFWRARLDLPDSLGGFWIQRSFTFLSNQSPGWSQSHADHWLTVSKDSILYNNSNNLFGFDSLSVELKILAERFFTSGRGVYISGKQPAGSGSVNGAGACSGRNLLVVDFDSKNLLNNNYPQCGSPTATRSYVAFNMSLASDRTKFVNHINQVIPKGNFVCISSYYPGATNKPFIQIKDWNDSVMNAFASIGVDTSKIRNIKNDSTSIGIIGKKGWNLGLAGFGSLLDTNISNAGGDTLVVTKIIKVPVDRGRLTSIYVGPVAQWNSVTWDYFSVDSTNKNIGLDGSDIVGISVIGLDSSGIERELISASTLKNISLSSINPIQFPRIRLQFQAMDTLKRSAPQLKIWSINFQPLPEASIITGKNFQFYSDTLQEGDTLRIQYGFQNIGEWPIKNYYGNFIVQDQNRNVATVNRIFIDSLNPNEIKQLACIVPTIGIAGNNLLELGVYPDSNFNERIYSNNYSKDRFFVKSDKRPPIFEALVDGKPILNQDIVAPNPHFKFTVTDDNRFLNLNDTANIRIFIKYPGAADFEPIYYTNNPDIQWINSGQKNKGEAIFTPKNLPDGWYEIQVAAFDQSKNASGKIPYNISFQVLNKAAVSNFFPYPNPFSTSTRFVFTITGAQVPDQISIRIYSLSGRLVREITEKELGTLRIGNNISDFAWNGTDQFGDLLANGVYFYQVVVKENGKNIDSFKTDGDQFFKHGIGKMYLMR